MKNDTDIIRREIPASRAEGLQFVSAVRLHPASYQRGHGQKRADVFVSAKRGASIPA